jgi:hypothetical protein
VVGEDLSDMEFFRAMVAFFGARRALGLIGLCIGWQLGGVTTWRGIEAAQLGDHSTWYRARADLRRFRDHLGPLGEFSGDVVALEERVASLGRLAREV